MDSKQDFQEHYNWQNEMVAEGNITEKQNKIGIDLVEDIISSLSLCSDTRYNVTVPAAGVSPEEELFYSWNREEHHIEFEIFDNRPVEFFYYNRVTQESLGVDLPIEFVDKWSIPRDENYQDILSKLKLIFSWTDQDYENWKKGEL